MWVNGLWISHLTSPLEHSTWSIGTCMVRMRLAALRWRPVTCSSQPVLHWGLGLASQGRTGIRDLVPFCCRQDLGTLLKIINNIQKRSLISVKMCSVFTVEGSALFFFIVFMNYHKPPINRPRWGRGSQEPTAGRSSTCLQVHLGHTPWMPSTFTATQCLRTSCCLMDRNILLFDRQRYLVLKFLRKQKKNCLKIGINIHIPHKRRIIVA